MRRKYLHIIIAAALVMSLLPVGSMPGMLKNSIVYAEQKSAEEICEILGVLKGEGEGLTGEYLSKKTERLQAVIMTLRLAGNNYEEIAMAYEGSDNFADADEILWKEGRNILAYIKANPQFGWRGSTDGKFIPRGIITVQMFYKVLLEALGYKQDYGEGGDFKWEEVMDFAFYVGLWDLTGVEELTNRDMAVGIVEALQLPVKSSNKTLLEKLVEDGSIDAEKAIAAGLMAQEPDDPQEPQEPGEPDELGEPEIIEIISLKEIDLGTYYEGDEIILPETVTAVCSNGEIKEVPVEWDFDYKNLREGYNTIIGDAEGTNIMTFATLNLIMHPLEVTSVDIDNLLHVYIHFNKAVDDDRAGYISNYYVEQEEVEKKIEKVTLSEDKMQVTLLLGSPLKIQKQVFVTVKKELGLTKNYSSTVDNVMDRYAPKVVSVEAFGNKMIRVVYSEPVRYANYSSNYTLDGRSADVSGINMINEMTVDISLSKRLDSGLHNLGVKTGVVDYAGFKVMQDPIEFNIEDDTTSQDIEEIIEATQTKVKLKFNKPVEPILKEQVIVRPGGRVASITYENDMRTYTVEFERTAALQPEGGQIGFYSITDFYGNRKTVMVDVIPVVDRDMPEYLEYEIKDQDKIILEFSEDVVPTGAAYILKNSRDEVIPLAQMGWYTDSTGKAHRNRVVLQCPGGAVFEPGLYTLSIEDVVDYTPLENRIIPLTVEFSIADDISPAVEYVRVKGSKFYIHFNESLDETTATSRNSYHYLNFKTYASELFPQGTTYEMIADGRTVVITLPDSFSMNMVNVLQISAIMDNAGNEMEAVGISAPFSSVDTPPRITGAAVVDKNVIVLSLSRGINDSTLTPEDFLITAGNEIIRISEASHSEGKITLFIDGFISSSGQYAGKDIYVQTAYDEPFTMDIYGQPIQKTSAPIKAVDQYAPYATGFITEYRNGNTNIIISLNENIRASNGTGKPLANNDSELKQFIVLSDNKVAPVISSLYEDATGTSTARIILTISENHTDKKLRIMFFAGPNNTLTDYSPRANPLSNFELP